jgi:hypothetical protein
LVPQFRTSSLNLGKGYKNIPLWSVTAKSRDSPVKEYF